MNSTLLNTVLMQISLSLSQFSEPSVSQESLFGIRVTAEDIRKNFNSDIPFRALMLKNTVHNIFDTEAKLKNHKYCKAGESLLFAACSAITAVLYPQNNNWGSYNNKMSPNQLLIASAICLISCANATLNPVFKDFEHVSRAEKLLAGGICTIPFFYSFQYFAFNVNK